MTKTSPFPPNQCPLCSAPLEKIERIAVDLDVGVAVLDDKAIILTPNEAVILDMLVTASPRVISREFIMSKLYTIEADEPDIKIIDIFICRLRKTLTGTSYRIDSLWGKGYRLLREEVE